MRILLVCSRSFKGGQTGDATQGRETVHALKELGQDVQVVMTEYFPLRFYDLGDRQLMHEELISIVRAVDVVHLLPVNPVIVKFWRTMPKRPLLGSSIYWGGIERAIVAWRNGDKLKSRLKGFVKSVMPLVHCRMDYRGVDVFLPNSQAEGHCLMRDFVCSPRSTFVAVPNGFVAPSRDYLLGLKRPDFVPKEDYVVVPGVFAWRKNQLAFIQAIRESNIPVVFMGGPACGIQAEFYERCRREATVNMHFIGYKHNTSVEYWASLKYARCACLASDCETPGIALLEAAYAGARPVVTKYGGTHEYYGFDAEYLNPCSKNSIRDAVTRAWVRGRLSNVRAEQYEKFTWSYCAECTFAAYKLAVSTLSKNLPK